MIAHPHPFLPHHAEARPREFSARLRRGGGALAAHRRRVTLPARFAVLAAAVALVAVAIPGEWGAARPVAAEGRDARAAGIEAADLEALHSPQVVDIDGDMAGFADPADPILPTPTAEPGAARAFAFSGSATSRMRAGQCLAMAVYYEAASESEGGQRAVAQVVLNRVAHPSYPASVCGVVFQGSERRTGCQFTFTCDGSLARIPSAAGWSRARGIAERALTGAIYAPVGLATHYHTLVVHPFWASSLDTIGIIGSHIFYRWRGAAGSRAAFTTRYAGYEPPAAPHPRDPAAEIRPVEDPAAIARAFASAHPQLVEAIDGSAPRPGRATPAASATAKAGPVAGAPDYVDALRALGGDARFKGGTLPGGGGVRAEFKDSGRWIAQPGDGARASETSRTHP